MKAVQGTSSAEQAGSSGPRSSPTTPTSSPRTPPPLHPIEQVFRVEGEAVRGFTTLNGMSPHVHDKRAKAGLARPPRAASASGGATPASEKQGTLGVMGGNEVWMNARLLSSASLGGNSDSPVVGLGLTNIIRTELWMRCAGAAWCFGCHVVTRFVLSTANPFGALWLLCACGQPGTSHGDCERCCRSGHTTSTV